MTITTVQAQLLIGGASVLFSAVLVIVTYFYYTETQRHTKEMRKSREAEFKPVIKGTVENWHTLHNRFAFENTGNGAAHDVTARWGFSHLDKVEEWSIPLMTPGQRHHFWLPFDGDERITTNNQIEAELEDTDGTLFFEVECKDALGNVVQHKEEIQVLDTVQSRAGELLEKDEQREIRKAIEDVSNAVGDVSSEIEMAGFEAALRRVNQDSVKEIVEQHGTLTLSELVDHSGLSQFQLVPILHRLRRSGVVDYEEENHLYGQDSLETEIRHSS